MLKTSGGPPCTWFSLPRIHYQDFWLMYAQVGDFPISRGPPSVPLTQISCKTLLSKSQNASKAGTLCRWILTQKIGLKCDLLSLSMLLKNVKRSCNAIFCEKYWLHYGKFLSNSVDLMQNLPMLLMSSAQREKK